MAQITTGLTKNAAGKEGVTAHYKFSYDSSMRNTPMNPTGPEPNRTNAVIAACENDYKWMSDLFGGGVNVTGLSVQVTTAVLNTCGPGGTAAANGACWNGNASASTVQLIMAGEPYSANPAYLRYLLISEVTELFMFAQNKGWFQGGNEGSKGEGLSRFLGGEFLAQNNFLDLGIDADFAVANDWLNSPRNDFVNNAPSDNKPDATNGCTTLFIYYLCSQLGFSIKSIVSAGASTLAGVYKNLTGDPADPFPLFKQILDLSYPGTAGITKPNWDNPFPLPYSFVEPQWIITPLPSNKWLLIVSGTVIVNLICRKKSAWRNETVRILPDFDAAFTFAGNDLLKNSVVFQTEQYSTYGSANSMFDKSTSVNAGFAVDAARPFFSEGDRGITVGSGIELDIAVQDIDATLLRVAYQLMAVGQFAVTRKD